MQLPLFKGISADQLSTLLEKTCVEFVNFEDGQIIAAPDDPVVFLNYVMGGRARIEHLFKEVDLKIVETVGHGALLAPTHLFGLNTVFNVRISAIGKTSILRFTKDRFMDIIESDRIYLFNFLNYLSAAAQRREYFVLDLKEINLANVIKRMAKSITSPWCESLIVEGEAKKIADFCGMSLQEFNDWKNNQNQTGDLRVTDNGIIII